MSNKSQGNEKPVAEKVQRQLAGVKATRRWHMTAEVRVNHL